jgi:hypothetical protein
MPGKTARLTRSTSKSYPRVVFLPHQLAWHIMGGDAIACVVDQYIYPAFAFNDLCATPAFTYASSVKSISSGVNDTFLIRFTSPLVP